MKTMTTSNVFHKHVVKHDVRALNDISVFTEIKLLAFNLVCVGFSRNFTERENETDYPVECDDEYKSIT